VNSADSDLMAWMCGQIWIYTFHTCDETRIYGIKVKYMSKCFLVFLSGIISACPSQDEAEDFKRNPGL
jgi:hypothetical protein